MSADKRRKIVVADIGGTHARFAVASIIDGQIATLNHQIKMKSADHASLQMAWEAYGREIGRDLPAEASIAVAGPVGGDVLNFTNNSWTVRPEMIPEKLKLERYTLVNDFGAVSHAAVHLGDSYLSRICGPDENLADEGLISIIGPGTGLGAAHVIRKQGYYHVTETEGGHIDFAPLDAVEDRLLSHLRKQHRRVSVERVTSGPALKVIYQVLADIEQQQIQDLDDSALWQLALSGEDSLASAALERFCLCLGSVVGDLALAQGAKGVILAGGLGRRLSSILPSSGFCERFVAKGRFQSMMEQIPVKQLIYDEPGLYGAAAAFLQEHG